MVPVSRITDWSATALLVEADTVWVGLARHQAEAPAPGGLVRHDMKTGRAVRYPVEDLIEVIVRAPVGLVLGTTNGIYVLNWQPHDHGIGRSRTIGGRDAVNYGLRGPVANGAPRARPALGA